MVKKLTVLVFSFMLLAVSLYGIRSQSAYVPLFINLSQNYILFRVIICAVLLTYVFVPIIRIPSIKRILGLSGFGLTVLGFSLMISPTLFGFLRSYILLGDALTIIESGILSIVLSVELPVGSAIKAAKPFGNPASNVSSKFRAKQLANGAHFRH